MRADTSYHKARKALWDSLVKNITFENHDNIDSHTEVDDDMYTTLYSFLTAKNDKTQDSARLSFLVTLNSLLANLELPPPTLEPSTPLRRSSVELKTPETTHSTFTHS